MKSLDDIKKHISESDIPAKRHAGFEVPDNYFQNLSDSILAKATEEEIIVTRKINWYRYSAVAASISILLVCIFLLNRNTDSGVDTMAMTDLTPEESYDFILAEDLDDISTEDILDLENIDEILEELEEELRH